jgi:hypothetical protein
MSLNVSITGLEKLQRELEEAQRGCQSLNGTIATIKINPADPNSVREAIRKMEAAVDSKVTSYRNNILVSKMAKAMKETYRAEIPKRAKNAQNNPFFRN